MERVRIGDRWVGEGEPCFVIAEAGSNHNGSLEQAKRLIELAAQAGADAVKFQTFRASKLYPRGAGTSDYLGISKSIYDIIYEMEMPYSWIPQLADFCRQNQVVFLASAFDEESADQLDEFVPAHKIASYEMTHLPLVEYVARKGKPVFMSTGTANLDEVRDAVQAFLETGNRQLVLLQCTASYPAPVDSLNLRAIATMREAFQVPVGLSDHSRDPLVGPLAAVALGACVIEKHITLSNELPGPDHRFAIEPAELRLMVEQIRKVQAALGDGEKTVQPVENELRAFARRSIFATREIAAGEMLSAENIAVLRCGKLTGVLEPKAYPQLLNRRATRRIAPEESIAPGDYA